MTNQQEEMGVPYDYDVIEYNVNRAFCQKERVCERERKKREKRENDM